MEDCFSSRFESLRDGLESFRLSDDDLESITKSSFLVLSNTMYIWSKVHEEARSITALIVKCARLDVQT